MTLAHSFRARARQARLMGKALFGNSQQANPRFLMYHSIADAQTAEYVCPAVHKSVESFEADLEYLAANYDVISLDDYLETVDQGRKLPRRCALISFDDGYLDNLQHAFPLLKARGMPAIIYLATKYIDTTDPQWVDRLYSMLRFRGNSRIAFKALSGQTWNLENSHEATEFFRQMSEALISKSYHERNRLLTELADCLGFEREMPRLTLNWAEVEDIVQNFDNITLGLHTDQHLDVSRYRDELHGEVMLAFDKLKNATGLEARHFSFPYGRSYPGSQDVLKTAGMHSAVSSTPAYDLPAGGWRFHLPRIDSVEYSRSQWWYAD